MSVPARSACNAFDSLLALQSQPSRARARPRPGFRAARRNLSFLVRAVIGVWVVARMGGCASAPDPSNFAAATHSLKLSVRDAGALVERQLETANSGHAIVSDFASHWSVRNRAMQAASDYSQSLVSIFAQSRSGQPQQLSQSLQALAQSLGVGGASPGLGVLATTADTIAFLHAQIALVRASHSLEQAINAAQPVIERLTVLIVSDTNDLDTLVRASAAQQRLALAHEYNQPLAFAQSVDRRRGEIRAFSYSELGPSEREELAQIDRLKASVASELDLYVARLAAVDAQESAALGAIASTRRAIESWADAHNTLARSVRNGRPPDISKLTESLANLHALLARLEAI